MSKLPIQDLIDPITQELNKLQQIYDNHLNACFDKMLRYSRNKKTECTYFIPSIGTQITLTRDDIQECVNYITEEFKKHNINVVQLSLSEIYINWEKMLIEQLQKKNNLFK